jgi:bla regulator protein blaR1
MSAASLSASSGILKYVAEPAARSLMLGCFAALVLAVLRVRTVSLKSAVWRAVLVAALAMPFLGTFAPPIRLSVPVPKIETRAKAVAAGSAQPILIPEGRTAIVSPKASAPADALDSAPVAEASPAPTRNSRHIAWPLILAAAYFAIAFLLLARVLAGAALATRLARAATPICDATALRELAASARREGVRRQPLLAESEALVVPVTVGAHRPAILLPAAWCEWDDAKLASVLAHEVSHVGRRDPLVQRLALLHRAVFWFSPLAWWIERHLAELAERASDEAALAGGADRTRYAETLLSFFAALEYSRSRVWWQGVSMAKCGQAEKRLDRILAWRSAMPNQLRKSVIAGVAFFAVPVIAFTASVHPLFFDFPQSPAPAAPQPASAPAPSANPVVVPGRAPESPTVAPIAPPSPAVAAIAPVAPVGQSEEAMPPTPTLPSTVEMSRAREALLRARKSAESAARRVAAVKAELSAPATKEQLKSISAAVEEYGRAMDGYNRAIEQYRPMGDAQAAGGVSGGVGGGVPGGITEERDWGPRFVIVTKDSNSVTMSGSSEDEEHAKALRSKIPGDFIWFEHDEKPYIIRDQATVDRAKKLWEPQEELGRKQEALGRQQEALGKQQEELGRKMEEVHVKIPDLSAQMEKLETEMKQLSANGGTIEQIGDLQSEIGELQSRIGEIQSDAGRHQGEIGREQGELGRKQGELGRQQGELGRQQGELARQASREMKKLLDDAIARGLAQAE